MSLKANFIEMVMMVAAVPPALLTLRLYYNYRVLEKAASSGEQHVIAADAPVVRPKKDSGLFGLGI